jgi:hypothetical protein
MEKRSKENSSGTSSEQSVTESIKRLTAYNARAALNTEEQLLLFLQSWWSQTYNRPLKDPLLISYSLEELLYEFFDRIERTKAYKEQIEQESDKIEEDSDKAKLDWAEQEEQKELNALKAQETKPIVDPTKDPKNIAWMEEQVQQAKKIYGEDFGDDIDESFSR